MLVNMPVRVAKKISPPSRIYRGNLDMQITEMTEQDFKCFWPIFKEIVLAQETYAFDPNIGCEEAYLLWCKMPEKSFVLQEDGQILGSYYLKPNAAGPSAHICNCGYMVNPNSRGKGVARKLCQHSQQVAKELNYKAMQFNSVVSTNEVAVNLWKKLGFNIIGTIPKAYLHRKLGYVDSFIMHKFLD